MSRRLDRHRHRHRRQWPCRLLGRRNLEITVNLSSTGDSACHAACLRPRETESKRPSPSTSWQELSVRRHGLHPFAVVRSWIGELGSIQLLHVRHRRPAHLVGWDVERGGSWGRCQLASRGLYDNGTVPWTLPPNLDRLSPSVFRTTSMYEVQCTRPPSDGSSHSFPTPID